MANNSNEKVIKYRKPMNINLGAFIFGGIFIYIIVVLYLYATSSHIAGYEIKEGSLAVNNTFRAVAMRAETVYYADDSGYINYYAREGERVANGAMVYTVDESGKLGDILKQGYDNDENLTNEDLNELKTQIINYRNTYSDRYFDSVYDFKFNVEGTVMKLANQNIITSLSQITDQSVLDLIDYDYSTDTGIVVYSTDGLENLVPADLSEDIFIEENHEKHQLGSNSLVATSDPAYKLITEENWSVAFPITEDRLEDIVDDDYVKVKFIKTGDVSWGHIDIIENANGLFCKLDFTNSMITYALDRYLDIELQLAPVKGLKVPNSAIVEKDFYLIPKEYMTKSGNDEDGFMRETYLEDGTITSEFVEAQVYYSNDDEYYIDVNTFRIGDYIEPLNDNGDKFAIGKKASLIGVYNMNKGYADFTQISILYQNKEYSIVKSNTEYGLSVYDHIVLDGSAVNDDQFVFE